MGTLPVGKMALEDGAILVDRLYKAETVARRACGLLCLPKLGPGEGLLINPCGSIHTWGMTYPIDVVFLNTDHEIIKISKSVGPFMFSWAVGAKKVVELVGGGAERSGIVLGQKIKLH